MYAADVQATPEQLLSAALDGEESVSGRHLDNIAPCLFGGVTLVYGVVPPKVCQLALKGEWWVCLVSPAIQLSTKKARHVLPSLVSQQDFVQQMAYTAGLVAALTTDNKPLAKETLVDIYAEPRRAPLINGFTAAKSAAIDHGAIGCSISGAGPSIFALCGDQKTAETVGNAMTLALSPIGATFHVGKIATQGAQRL
jgi:homoserine kinase